MRQYDDPVEVRRGEAEDPDQFLDDEHETYGVFDLSFDWTDGRWQLVGCLD